MFQLKAKEKDLQSRSISNLINNYFRLANCSLYLANFSCSSLTLDSGALLTKFGLFNNI